MTRWGPFYVFFCFSLFIFVSNFQFKTTSERPKWPKQVKSFKASQGRSPHMVYTLHLLFCSKSQNLNILHFWPPSLLGLPTDHPPVILIFYIFVLINKSGSVVCCKQHRVSFSCSYFVLTKPTTAPPSKCKIPS